MARFIPGYWVDQKGTQLFSTTLVTYLSKSSTGIYLLDGPSSCGKTYIANQIREYRNVAIFTTESISDVMIAACHRGGGDLVQSLMMHLSGYDVCVIEDLDVGFKGKEVSQKILADVLSRIARDALVIITATYADSYLTDFQEQLPYIQKFNFQPL